MKEFQHALQNGGLKIWAKINRDSSLMDSRSSNHRQAFDSPCVKVFGEWKVMCRGAKEGQNRA